MGFSFNEFLDSTKEFVGSTRETISNVNNFFSSKEIEPLVKVAAPPTANLTAKQVESGKTGGQAPLPSSNFMSASFYGIPAALLLGVGAVYLLSKRRRG